MSRDPTLADSARLRLRHRVESLAMLMCSELMLADTVMAERAGSTLMCGQAVVK